MRLEYNSQKKVNKKDRIVDDESVIKAALVIKVIIDRMTQKQYIYFLQFSIFPPPSSTQIAILYIWSPFLFYSSLPRLYTIS